MVVITLEEASPEAAQDIQRKTGYDRRITYRLRVLWYLARMDFYGQKGGHYFKTTMWFVIFFP
jgi:hypothetical protein